MTVPPGEHFVTTYQNRSFYFCSELCQGKFLAEPAKFAAPLGNGGEGLGDTVRRVAYFSMEVGVDSRIPTYSGGLGVLAGDTLKSCADLKIPAVAVSLFYAKGYFDQRLDEWGNQQEVPAAWDASGLLKRLPANVRVLIEGRPVFINAWRFDVVGATGWVVPLILLDTNLEQNAAADREFTSSLYGGDPKYRLAQEIILGIGGIRMLRALGYDGLLRFHMNEGHASLLTLELLHEQKDQTSPDWEFKRVRDSCVFTTHTPVRAGHDRFSYELVKDLLEPIVPLDIVQMLGGRLPQHDDSGPQHEPLR
jgi:starch phosphorylase